MYYRKYLEPSYGEVAPEVNIMTPQSLDLDHPDIWREKSNFESIADMTAAMRKCNCYPALMRVRSHTVRTDLGEGEIRIKIFMPEQENCCDESLPVLIFYHGGGYVINSIEVYEYVFRYLCMSGKMIVVAPDYHLAPEYKFPKGLNEAFETLVWTRDHISSYGGDASCIFLGGDSSGGNFSTVVSLMSRDKNGPDIKGQILFYPVTTNVPDKMTDSERRYSKGYFLEYDYRENPWGACFTDPSEYADPNASPLLRDDLDNLPPACFISAECDPLLDQGLMYAAKLQDHGVSVEYHILKGMVHGFINWTYGKTFDALNIAASFIRKQ